MLAPSYATAADLANWLGIEIDDDDIGPVLALEAASRAIDRAAGRKFGKTDDDQTRVYEPQWDGYRNEWFVDIDDVMVQPTTVQTVALDGTTTDIDQFSMWPPNAAVNERPWTRIVFRRGTHVHCHEVRVTATFGWTEVPSAVRYACIIQAAKLYSRKESADAAMTEKRIDDVEYHWAASLAGQELDPDALSAIAGYRRFWAAV